MKRRDKYLGRALLKMVVLGVSGSSLGAAANACPDYRGPLATAEQISAERTAVRIAASPEVKALRPMLRQILNEDPAARLPDGSATTERAIDLFSQSLILAEIGGDPNYPQILWWNDNSPRCWFGHVFPGSAISGDSSFAGNASTRSIEASSLSPCSWCACAEYAALRRADVTCTFCG